MVGYSSVALYETTMPTMQTDIVISLRVNDSNENHHLWNNRGIWWCYITIYRQNKTTERLRFSLRTRSVKRARKLRDNIFSDIAKHYTILEK